MNERDVRHGDAGDVDGVALVVTLSRPGRRLDVETAVHRSIVYVTRRRRQIGSRQTMIVVIPLVTESHTKQKTRHDDDGLNYTCSRFVVDSSYNKFTTRRARTKLSCKILIFTARAYARAVLGVVILSVCLSIRPSVTRVDCDKTK